MLRITNRKDNSHSSQNAKSSRSLQVRSQEAKKSCCRSLFLSFLLSFVVSFFLFSFLPRLHLFLVFFMFSFFIYSCCLSVFLSFFLSFFPPPAWGSNIRVFLIPSREARNTVFYYKIQGFCLLLILICFFVDPCYFLLILDTPPLVLYVIPLQRPQGT